MRPQPKYPKPDPRAGFSLLELLIVVAIIVILAAVSFPAISRYIRNYQIQAGAQQVASELSVARTKAIMRNVNRAALFVVVDDTSYQWVMPDQQFIPALDVRLGPDPPGYRTLGRLRAHDQTMIDAGFESPLGPLRRLPTGLRFDPAGATTSVVAFNRLGGQCDPETAASCSSPFADLTGPAATTPATDYVTFTLANGEASVTIEQSLTGLRQRISVDAGGRIRALEGQAP